MRARTLFCAGLAVLAIVFPSIVQSALAAEPSGTAIAVRQSTSAAGEAGKRVLETSGPVFSGDVISTSAHGQAQIQFVDQTKLVVGPNSSLSIDQFVFASKSTASAVSVNAVRGAFRFITGVSPKSAYSIKTPTATIGVRGTRFDVSVINGITSFALFEGGARVCDKRGRCMDLHDRCDVVIVPSENDAQHLAPGAATTQYVAATLPYVFSQSSLQPSFRVDTAACGSAGVNPFAPVPGGPLSPAPQGGGDDGGEGGQ